MSKFLWAGLMVCFLPGAVVGQSSTGVHPVYRRAQTLVNDGNPAAGRALVDSMLSVATPGSNEYAEAIYWRAVLAATTAEAESDYRRLVVDHPLSPRVEDALIRLAQLEITRGNYDGALRHLNRVALEHPNSPSRARAGYWTARALFEKNDLPGGCSAASDALRRTRENDAELRNQINYLSQRCAGVSIAASPPPTRAAPAAGATGVVSSQPDSAGRGANAPVARESVSSTTSVIVTPPKPAPATNATAQTPVPKMQPPAKPRDVEPSMIEPTIPAPGASTKASATGTSYSVQVAAYNAKSQATTLAERLRKRGYEARVSGASAPFRVRIGRYASHAQAAAVQRSLKAKQIDGFVVQAESR